MKIIVSHDVDHLSVIEHYKDLIIPKLIIRSFLEKFKGRISVKELRGRIISLFTNKLQNIEELILFDKDNNVPSTFFVGVENGLGLSYSPIEMLSVDVSFLQLFGQKSEMEYTPENFKGTYQTITYIPGLGVSLKF